MVATETAMMMHVLPGDEDAGEADHIVAVWRLERVGDRPEPAPASAFCIITETPIVAISGNSSLPLRRSGAKIDALISQPSAAPTAKRDADRSGGNCRRPDA